MQTNENKKIPSSIKLFAIVAIVASLGIVGVYSMFLPSTPVTSVNSATTPSTHAGYVVASPVRHWDSTTKAYLEPASVLTEIASKSHNVYTNLGQNATRDALFHGGTIIAFTIISVGQINNSQTATDRCLANVTGAGAKCLDWYGNGLDPIAGTVKDINGGQARDFGNVSITHTFTCTNCVNTVINATGLYNKTFASAPTDGNVAAGDLNGLFAEANFTAATLQTNDQINVTWFVWSN